MKYKFDKIIKDIMLEKGDFLSLSEIYDLVIEKINGYNDYTDVNAAIRTALYRRCIDRDLRNDKDILFFSLYPKGTVGNKYGLIEWNK